MSRQPPPRFAFVRTRPARIAGVVALCYLVTLAVVNLSGAPFGVGAVLNAMFPRFGSGNVDQNSIAVEWNAIQHDYVFRNVAGAVGTQGAENGMVEALDQMFSDRFSTFLTKSQYAQLRATLSGRRAGSIGISVVERCAGATICPSGQQPSVAVIEDVLTGQPAAQAGVHRGDIVIAVNGRALSSLGSTLDERLDRASTLVRGQAGTTVTLTLERAGHDVDIRVTRANLNIPSVFSRQFGSVLYLQVSGFDTDTGDMTKTQLHSGLAAGATSVILDLRSNGGGFVTEAQKLASQFLTPSDTEQDVVVRRGRMTAAGGPASAQSVEHDRILAGGIATTPRLVVLVDGASASAAEIVAAALHDYRRAMLVGAKTFGKGSVQVDYPLPDGSDLHLTVERWYGPNGETIDTTGISPDQNVALSSPDDRFRLDAESPSPDADAQLHAALAMLQG